MAIQVHFRWMLISNDGIKLEQVHLKVTIPAATLKALELELDKTILFNMSPVKKIQVDAVGKR